MTILDENLIFVLFLLKQNTSVAILRVRTICVSSKKIYKKKCLPLYNLLSYIMWGLGLSDIILRHFLALLSMFSELEHIYPHHPINSPCPSPRSARKKKGTNALCPSFQIGPSKF